MEFLWPQALWLLVLAPLLCAAYVWLLRRRRTALRVTQLAAVRQAMGRQRQWRRHLPPALLLLALMVGVFALARPTTVISLPSDQRTIVLAIDVSLSMIADDVLPSRIEAAQAAAKDFVREQPADVAIAVVSFAGTAALVQAPTRNRDDAIAALDRLQLDRHTAIGSGIIMSLATIFPEQYIDLESVIFGEGALGGKGAAMPRRVMEPAEIVEPGSYASAAIVLLTDGRRTTGPDPVDAARMAADRGVKVYTVGFGTAEGVTVNTGGWQIFMRFDEEALRTIADITHAEYFYAGSAADLRKVYSELGSRFVMERRQTEVSALFSALAALLALLAGGLSLWWFNRGP
ncbi:MAG: VWA domain-containing protein [Rhodocyclaceae bacterium]